MPGLRNCSAAVSGPAAKAVIARLWAHEPLDAPLGLMLIDRDGVLINLAGRYLMSDVDIVPIPGVGDSIAALAAAGFKAVVVSNQSVIGRGILAQGDVLRLHERVLASIDPTRSFIQGSIICPHAPGDGCRCRKPQPHGILSILGAEARLRGHWFVGDQMTDLQCAKALAMRSALVRTGHGRETETRLGELGDRPLVTDDFPSFARWVLAELSREDAPTAPDAASTQSSGSLDRLSPRREAP